MQNDTLPLTATTVKLLKQKHPKSARTVEEFLLTGQPESIHQIKFENINVDAVRKTALKPKGGSGPSRMDADGSKRIVVSKQFAEGSADLCAIIANMIKKLCIEKDLANTLEAFLFCRFIPINKDGLQPLGAGEVLRRIIGKVIASTLRDDIITSVGPLQVCAG